MVSKKKKKRKVFTEIETDFSAEIRTSKVFSAQNQVVSKKKKKRKVFTEIETDFSAEIRTSKVFSAQNQVVSKKKRSSPKLRVIFRPKSEIQRFFPPKIRWSPKKKKERSSPKLRLIFRPISQIQTFEGGCFPCGGLFSIFHKKSASKAPKTCDFAYFASQWGGSSPPAPPGYATVYNTYKIKQKTGFKSYHNTYVYHFYTCD